jgi:Asp-tRNA(Asn)/Glu-tRNA(Gln) amidotransferase A subunit family amidase
MKLEARPWPCGRSGVVFVSEEVLISGVDLDHQWKLVLHDCRGVDETAALLESLGHRVEERSPEYDRTLLTQATNGLVIASMANTVNRRAEDIGVALSAEVVEHLTLRMLDWNRQLTADGYARCLNVIHATGRRLARFFDDWDVILSPVLLQPPVPLGYMNTHDPDDHDGTTYGQRIGSFWGFTSPYNATGAPAISLPLHWTPEGLPVGMQFAAPFGAEVRLLQLATQLEQARPWAHRRPNPGG